jgi:hypothetical protein
MNASQSDLEPVLIRSSARLHTVDSPVYLVARHTFTSTSTNSHSAMASTDNPQPFRFMDLPGEVRDGFVTLCATYANFAILNNSSATTSCYSARSERKLLCIS